MKPPTLLPRTRALIDRIISFLEARPALYKMALGVALKHDKWMGYQKYGLFRDDIVSEEYPVVKEALKRLSDKELFDRTFRLRRAIQLNLNRDTLPPAEHTRPDQDVPYLWRHVEAIARERDEGISYDNIKPTGTKDFFSSSSKYS